MTVHCTFVCISADVFMLFVFGVLISAVLSPFATVVNGTSDVRCASLCLAHVKLPFFKSLIMIKFSSTYM